MALGKDNFDKSTQERVRDSQARHHTNCAPYRLELLTQKHQESRSRGASKRSPEETPDDYFHSDIGYYNVPAESRALRRVGFGVLKVGTVVAIGIAVMDAMYKMTTAFTSLSSLFEGAAWGQFLLDLGAFTKIGLFVLAGALLWQLLRRRKKLRDTRSDRLVG